MLLSFVDSRVVTLAKSSSAKESSDCVAFVGRVNMTFAKEIHAPNLKNL